MPAGISRPSSNENVSTTLAVGITDVASSMDVADASAIVSPCYLIIDRVDSAGALKNTSFWEYVKVTNVSSNTLSITRAQSGSTGQSHSSGAIVEAVVTSAMFEDWYAALNPQHESDGVHSSALVTSLKASGAVVNIGTSDTTIVTPKAIADSYLGGATSNLQTQLNAQVLTTYDGWTSAIETWTYASASTITVPSGAASKYAVGDRIKWTQTTVKYGVIVAIADTVLTIAVNTDYVVTNAAITLNYYSHQENPLNFPSKFAYTATVSSGGGTLTTASAVSNFKLVNRTVILRSVITITTAGTGSIDIRLTLPISPAVVQVDSGGGRSLSTGASLNCYVLDSTKFGITDYANNYPGPTGALLLISLIYEL